MDPSIVGSLMGAASSLVGGWINNANAERLADKQFQQSIYLQDKQNAYNAPSAQMQRLQQAGLNPNLVYASGNAVMPSATASPAQQPHSQPIDTAGILQSIQMAVQGMLEKDRIQAQKEISLAQNETQLQGIQMSTSSQEKINTDRINSQEKLSKESGDLQKELAHISSDTQTYVANLNATTQLVVNKMHDTTTRDIASANLNENKRQFNATLNENKRQFDINTEINRAKLANDTLLAKVQSDKILSETQLLDLKVDLEQQTHEAQVLATSTALQAQISASENEYLTNVLNVPYALSSDQIQEYMSKTSYGKLDDKNLKLLTDLQNRGIKTKSNEVKGAYRHSRIDNSWFGVLVNNATTNKVASDLERFADKAYDRNMQSINMSKSFVPMIK